MAGKGILLEAGTNEMELLVFTLNETPFGINVAKVREIVQRSETIRIPHSPPAVEGSFRLRDRVLTLVNLGKYFSMEGEVTKGGDGMIIVVEFNDVTCGVLVDTVEVIYRLSWDQIEPPSQYLMSLQAPITGTAQVEQGKTVLIADFETIVGEILGVQSASADERADFIEINPKDVKILLADDSAVLRKTLAKILNDNGFENLTICSDGQHAWETLKKHENDENGPCDIVLSDIEMPRMDGLHLTNKIKEDPNLANLPVILFSSLITEDNRRKGEAVGADAQVSKPDSANLLHYIEQCLAKKGKNLLTENTDDAMDQTTENITAS
jgi:two-component system chemotaxis response regulator CheV